MKHGALVLAFLVSSVISEVTMERPSVQISGLNFEKENKESLTIAFGSCYGLENKTNDIFRVISGIDERTAHDAPDVFLWTGDVAYTDEMMSFLMDEGTGYNSIEHIKDQYERTKAAPYYQDMIKRGVKIVGVWDDHDYGINNGGKEFPLKRQTREIFLDFIGEPSDSPRRLDADSPIHQDYTLELPYTDD